MNDKYEIIIGLETHAELNTNTKIFCSCINEFGGEVNSHCCPKCLGLPGALPSLNEQVVYSAIKMGKACKCKINNICKQDRKHYFYPDLTKGYQISQFDIPLCENGNIDVVVNESGETKNIRINRIHIEEDAGKLIHNDNIKETLVDYNRCGVPLIEIVTEPDLRSSKEAKAYLDTIKSFLMYLDVSDCKMQEGSIRCDVNVSVRLKGEKEFGTRVEMKNVNSFSGVCHAIDYEAARQIKVLEEGGEIHQETRRWDDLKGTSFVLRTKEDAQDYSYFPEPDLLTISVPDIKVLEIQNSIPELPNYKLLRYMKDFSLPFSDAQLLVDNSEKGNFFEETCKINKNYKAISNWINGEISSFLSEKNILINETKLSPKSLSDMIYAIDSKIVSNTAAKDILSVLYYENKDVNNIIKEKGLAQVSDENALKNIVLEVLSSNKKAVEDYKNGKTNVIGFLIGMCMKASKGKGNPEIFKDLVIKELSK